MISPASIVPAIGFLFFLAIAGAALGIWLADMPHISRRAVPFSGGVLIGIALFWVTPEIVAQFGFASTAVGVLVGFTGLQLIDRYVYQVCPACSHSHDHPVGVLRLPGFALPLVGAACIHSFFDGWAAVLAQSQLSKGIRMAFLAGIGVHKIPEGLALGVLLLAATNSAWKALLGSAGIQMWMWLGGLLALSFSSRLGMHWSGGLLAVAAGVFLFLGYHAIEGEYRERGWAMAFMPALTGAAGAAMLRLLPGL